MDLRKIGETIATHGILAVLAVALGIVIGNSETAAVKDMVEAQGAMIATLKDENAALSAKLSGRRTFINDASDRIELLCRKDPECWQGYGKMERPE